MTTVIRTDPDGFTRSYSEYSPQEVDAERLRRRIEQMVTSGHHKSELGSPNAAEFIADCGHKTAARRKNF